MRVDVADAEADARDRWIWRSIRLQIYTIMVFGTRIYTIGRKRTSSMIIIKLDRVQDPDSAGY